MEMSFDMCASIYIILSTKKPRPEPNHDVSALETLFKTEETQTTHTAAE